MAAARELDPSAVVWKGVKILGILLGHLENVQHQLQGVSASHRQLLERIPSVQDLQAAWLLLLCCAGTRANYLLRAIPPTQTEECLTRILGADISLESWEVANLLSLGGLGLRSPPRVSKAAYWSSWADCVQTTAKRQPAVAEQLVAA